MGHMTVACPVCGNMTTVPPGATKCYCTACGTELTVPSTTIDYGFAPLLDTWQTKGGFVAMGVVASILVNGCLNMAASNVATRGAAIAVVVVAIAFALACLAYALFVYPTYFRERPLVRTSEAVSFLNGLLGGLIFGCIWCYNLTNRKLGISHIVYAVLLCLVNGSSWLMSYF